MTERESWQTIVIPEEREEEANSTGVLSSIGDSRLIVANRIERILLERRPSNDPIWREKIRKMARKLEHRLFAQASSLSEHCDERTLRSRLQRLASNIIENRSSQSLSHSQGVSSVDSNPGQGASGKKPSGQTQLRFTLHRIAPAA
mmetsp:Transcript_4667/g.3344  ORF Transcript_4667/g.3344 Transcript_4667/m.3344 type:complete len:146 (-) Transcript_4667:888-1325(-)